MMFSNWLVVVEPPADVQRVLERLPCGVGGAPTWPAVTCWLCCWIAEMTSCGIRLRACSLFGSSQTRIEYWPAPNTETGRDERRREGERLGERTDAIERNRAA